MQKGSRTYLSSETVEVLGMDRTDEYLNMYRRSILCTWCIYNISASNLRSNGYLSHLIVLSKNTLHITLKLFESTP
jgi:hypothetical protein